ncbi:DUF3592 domain-containing protein [Magnetococcales bacterium HHB-1]
MKRVRPFYYAVNTTLFFLGLSFLVMGVYPFVKASESEQWPSAYGQVEMVQVEPSYVVGWGMSLAHRVHIRFNYTVDNVGSFSGRRIDFGIGSRDFIFRAFADRVVERYPVGKTVRIYYNAENPRDAVLERAPSMGSSIFWIILGILLLVSSLFICSLREIFKGNKQAEEMGALIS